MCLWHVCACPCWTGVCPSPRLGAEALIPVHLPAGSSQQSSSSHCLVRTSVSACLSPSGCVCCCCRCCSYHQRWLIELDKPSSKSCRCSRLKLLAPLFQLLLSWPSPLSFPTSPICPFSLLYSSPRCPAPGQGHLPPPGVPVLWG